MSAHEKETLAGVAAAAVPEAVRARFCEQVELYLEELLAWNARGNLVSSADTARLVSRHLVESLACLPMVDLVGGTDLIDLGSGGGFPGIPIKLARPELRIALVEARRMKALFLSRVIRTLGLSEATVWPVRLENLGRLPAAPRAGESTTPRGLDLGLDGDVPRARPQADVVTARAVASLHEVSRWAAPVVRPGGHLIAFKGTRAEAEIVEWQRKPGPWGIFSLVPGGPNGLCLVVLERLDLAGQAG